ncbi:MAG TPA: recombinase zinc beta ribbon domain-containing protein [bacterium]|nr:recombinase zinc beta ribbon domain-containing protein [bacterium]
MDKRIFREVQKLLQLNSQNRGADTRNKHGALLRGLLKCGHCGAAMAHTYTQKGNRLYRYYMCLTKMKRGKDACPTPTLPAQEIEDFVVEQIKTLARDPELQRQVFQEASSQQKQQVAQLASERKRLQRQLQARKEEARRLAGVLAQANGDSPTILKRITEVETASATMTARIADLGREMAAAHHNIDFEHLRAALTEFDAIWEALTQAEQARLVSGLVAAVACDFNGVIGVSLSVGANQSLTSNARYYKVR